VLIARERILIVGGDEGSRERYLAELCGAGLSAEPLGGMLEDGEDAALVLVAGGAEGSRRDGVGALIDAVQAARSAARDASVIACVPRAAGAEAIDASIESGADDVLVTPLIAGTLLARVRAGLRLWSARVQAMEKARFGDALAALGASQAVSADSPDGLHELLSRICEAIDWARAGLLVAEPDQAHAILVAASDDPSLSRVPLALDRYPEVRACLERQTAVLIEETGTSQLLGEWARLAAEKGGDALLAVPILQRREAVGVLLLHSTVPRPSVSPAMLEFLRGASALLGLQLRASGVFESLKEQTRRTSLDRFNAERRRRALDQYKDFFQSSSDGMMVLETDGAVLYMNRSAELMTGWATDGLGGRPVTDIVAQGQREALLEVVQKIAGGANLESFDLSLRTTSGETLTVSVSSSSVLAEHQAAILAFRDVTEARALEAELKKTKEFLERLIDSAVDGIIAADLSGRIILFNQGASRLFGYSAEQVIGKLPVWKLYPEGVARTIMTELRADEQGGKGRLLPTRRDIVAKDGEIVPVTLTASIVYEHGREVASVGIMSDLRERLRIEQRLQQAQEKLLESEKQALIAELAGTTAHELNQPLTSVMGYSELLKKKMAPEDVHYRAVDIILREAERMAEIVRKIGRITRYETKAYVGSTQILDLDKSTTNG
jgi:PAS domain S-box-containing protein